MSHKLLGSVLALSMLGVASAHAQCAAAGSTEVSLNKPVVVSSTTIPNGAQYAVDGNLATGWQSATGGLQWLEVNLGRPFAITELAGIWSGIMYPTIGEVDWSQDGNTWSGVFEIGGMTAFDVHLPTSGGLNTNQSYQYIRVLSRSPNAATVMLNELRICGYVRG
jgi:hypothetical protein